MNVFRHLMGSLEHWQSFRFKLPGKTGISASLPLSSGSASQPQAAQTDPFSLDKKPCELADTSIIGQFLKPHRAFKRRNQVRNPRALFAITVISLTAAIGQRFYNQPELQVGTAAPQTLVAPRDATVVDVPATEAKQKAARNGVLRVLRIDREATEKINKTLNTSINQVEEARSIAGTLPFFDSQTISTQAQSYLRQAEEADWVAINALVMPGIASLSGQTAASAQADLEKDPQFQALSWEQQKAVGELLRYRQRMSQQKFLELQIQIADARRQYQQAKDILGKASQGTEKPLDPSLLDLSDAQWEATRMALYQAASRMTAQGIMPGLPPELLNQAVQMQLKGIVPAATEATATQILTAALQPNLIEDPDRTRLQAEMAAEAVEPVSVTVQTGEVIVNAGEPITQSDFVLLDYFKLSQRRFNWLDFAGFSVLVGSSVLVFLVVERRFHTGLRRRDYLMISLLIVGTAGLNVVGVAAYSLPAVGLLTGSFYGSALGGTVVALLAILLPVGANVSVIPLVATAAGGIVCSVMSGRMRSREELALLGGCVGLTQGVVYLLLTLIFSAVSPSAWYSVLTGAALQGAYGIISSIVALGLSPYLEHLFDLVTPIRLAELANPNRPLLKRLASETPGTFQHTVFVATLAEAAAHALSCNVELVRAGTLYHDIGKMHDPLGFIENQMGGPNKHDTLDDPWLSARIIKKHVTEGIVMARKYRLPKAVQAFIPEHQGTMQIAYFYHQAQERAAQDSTVEVREEDFRYDGPTPQSPETGIVMLADSCEAALRSMKEATPEEALALVNRILRARWKDNQLVDSGLTREHMTVIAEIFVQVWQQYNHKRIAYPKASLVSTTVS